jgi:hypothetical protein
MFMHLRDELVKVLGVKSEDVNFNNIEYKTRGFKREYGVGDKISCVNCGTGIRNREGVRVRKKNWVCYDCFRRSYASR